MGLDVADAVCRAQLRGHHVYVSTLDEDSDGRSVLSCDL